MALNNEEMILTSIAVANSGGNLNKKQSSRYEDNNIEVTRV